MEISLSLKEELRKRSTLPESSFELWFGDFVLTSLTEDKAIFSTPTVVRKNILKTALFPHRSRSSGVGKFYQVIALLPLLFSQTRCLIDGHICKNSIVKNCCICRRNSSVAVKVCSLNHIVNLCS